MALTPNFWTEHVVENYLDPATFQEGVLRTTIRQGWYKSPALTQDQLIEREEITLNQYSTVMHKTFESWDYEIAGGAPRKHYREVYSKAYIPEYNPGRGLKLMEQETTIFWTFTGWSKDALAYRRELDGIVVYDLKPDEDWSAEAKARAEALGLEADLLDSLHQRQVVASARKWDEAIQRGSLVEKADVNQTYRWMTGIEIEETDVTEEPDRYTIWTYKKFAIRPDQYDVEGPKYVQKEDYKYKLHVPVASPTVDATSAGEQGVRVDIRGGGARITVPLQTGARRFDRQPDKYRVFRKTIDENIEPSTDPFDIYTDDPLPRPRTTIIETRWVGDYDGVEDPDEGLPTQTSYTEPSNTEQAVDDGWRSVGDVENQADEPERHALATLYDGNVNDGATYAYAAIAVVQDSESPLSPEDRVTYSGESGKKHHAIVTIRQAEDGSLEGDLEMPDDPALSPDPEVGEMVEFEVPAAVTWGPWDGAQAADQATLTVSATPAVEVYTFSHTPKSIPEAWAYGRKIRIVDAAGPGIVDASGVSQPHVIYGMIQTSSDTQTTVHHLNSDGHTYPIGALIEPLAENYDDRVVEEDGDLEALVLAIGQRQGLRNREESFSVSVDLTVPFLGLASGQRVIITDVGWDAWGNDLWLKSAIANDDWVLKGYTITVERNPDGTFRCDGTHLTLEQR